MADDIGELRKQVGALTAQVGALEAQMKADRAEARAVRAEAARRDGARLREVAELAARHTGRDPQPYLRVCGNLIARALRGSSSRPQSGHGPDMAMPAGWLRRGGHRTGCPGGGVSMLKA